METLKYCVTENQPGNALPLQHIMAVLFIMVDFFIAVTGACVSSICYLL